MSPAGPRDESAPRPGLYGRQELAELARTDTRRTAVTEDEQIRTLVERWVEAVHAGDLDAVLADHARDIVMFDVPPPR